MRGSAIKIEQMLAAVTRQMPPARHPIQYPKMSSGQPGKLQAMPSHGLPLAARSSPYMARDSPKNKQSIGNRNFNS